MKHPIGSRKLLTNANIPVHHKISRPHARQIRHHSRQVRQDASGAEVRVAEAVDPVAEAVRQRHQEPVVRQPLTMTFDDRGRMWIIQYLQYPHPAGLKPVEVDQYLRTKYDRVPEPPPRGTPGADRITILEDTDGDGRVDRSKDFVAGLNLATGLALGHGGV